MENISRRKFLQDTSRGLGFLFFWKGMDAETQANRLLEVFPSSVNGAQKVEKFTYPQAKYLLVQIAQMHYYPGTDEFFFDQIEKWQDSIYQVLSNIQPMFGFDRVYKEGITEAGYQFVPVKCDRQSDVEQWFANRDGTNRFSLEGKIKIVPAESKAAFEAATRYKQMRDELEKKSAESGKEIDDDFWRQYYETLYARRENIALGIISEDAEKNPEMEPLFVMVYGGMHEFNSVIKKWNSRNPDKKFSYVRIIPNH